MSLLTEQIRVAVPPELKQAIKDEATRRGLKPSDIVRLSLREYFQPDEVTLERCLIDPGVEYEADRA